MLTNCINNTHNNGNKNRSIIDVWILAVAYTVIYFASVTLNKWKSEFHFDFDCFCFVFFSAFFLTVFRFYFCFFSCGVQALDDYDVQQDLPQALKLLGEMNHNVKQVSDLVESMLQRVKTGELTTEYGLSFLEIKYHMLLTYLINLTYVVLRKCSGLLSTLSSLTQTIQFNFLFNWYH